jgi:uncharacterized integral membrane protein
MRDAARPALIRALSWIITLPLLAIAVIFAVNHRDAVPIDLWPLPMEVAVPLYMLVLVGIFVGFVLGGILTWLSQGRHRRRARQRRYRVEQLERDLDSVQKKLDSLKSERAQAAATDGWDQSRALPGERTEALPPPRMRA